MNGHGDVTGRTGLAFRIKGRTKPPATTDSCQTASARPTCRSCAQVPGTNASPACFPLAQRRNQWQSRQPIPLEPGLAAALPLLRIELRQHALHRREHRPLQHPQVGVFAPVNIEKRKLCEHRPCLLDNVHRSGMHFLDLFEGAASEFCSDQVAEAALWMVGLGPNAALEEMTLLPSGGVL